MNKLEDYFFNKDKKCTVSKWHHYFDIYNSHFSRFLGQNPNILEIGVSCGGSLEMWNYYFNGDCSLYGIDKSSKSLNVPTKLKAPNIQVHTGDQADREFWKQYLQDKPKFDIVIDDGGHTMTQQIITFEEVYNHVSENGVYLCEDLHTSYWSEFEGGYKKPGTFIEYSKIFIDALNVQHFRKDDGCLHEVVDFAYNQFRNCTKSVHYYDSVIVVEKGHISKSVASSAWSERGENSGW